MYITFALVRSFHPQLFFYQAFIFVPLSLNFFSVKRLGLRRKTRSFKLIIFIACSTELLRLSDILKKYANSINAQLYNHIKVRNIVLTAYHQKAS